MFASVELARRIDAAEAHMLAAMVELARGRGTPDVEATALGGGIASYVRPGAPMNKVIGLGFDGPIDAAALAGVERRWRTRKEPLQVELSTLARCETAEQFTARGYQLRAFENVLGADPAAAASGPPPPHPVERADDRDIEAWIACIADGFLQPDGSGAGTTDSFARADMIAAMQETMAVPGMRRYAVRIGGVLAGGASMRIDPQGVAQLCGAATLPAFRRRGVQTALLQARLREASAAGCDIAVITTQPGSKSQQNAQGRGFVLLYARAILVKPTS